MQYLKTYPEVQDYIRSQDHGVLALDLETTGLDPFEDKILQIAACWEEGRGVLFDAEHLTLLSQLSQGVTLVFHNMKYDLHMLYRAGLDFRDREIYDTMLLHHLVDENKPHGLDEIVQEMYGDKYKEEFWEKYKTYEEASEEDKLAYACKDVMYTRGLYQSFSEHLDAHKVPESLVTHVHELALSLLDTEIEGLAVDKPYLMDTGVTLLAHIERLRPELRAYAEDEIQDMEIEAWSREQDKRKTPKGKAGVDRPTFSFDSSKQLIALLYTKLGLEPQKNAKTKQPSADDEALNNLAECHPLIPKLLEYRGHNKVYGTYIQGTLERMRNGRIYPSFNVNGTVTGRISSSNPNMQQLPKEGGIRGIYIPDAGHKLITCDYQQLEVSLAAHFSRDANLLRIVLEGASQHDITAQSLGIPRDYAKTLNFAMQYRCSAWKVAKILSVSIGEATHIFNKYWETYSGLKGLMDECDAKIDRGEPIITPFGRQRHFPVMERQPWDKAYRQGFNALIQGTGADLTSRAFYLVAKRLKEGGLGRALFPVHDELVVQAKEQHVHYVSGLLQGIMANLGMQINLTVPLGVSCSEGLDRWTK